jgi:uncharacterized membrane-anchored protein YjiN (DUF445 family)
MALDERVLDALERVIRKRKQPNAVTKRLSAWLNALSSDPSALERADEVKKHIANVLEVVDVGNENDGEVAE